VAEDLLRLQPEGLIAATDAETDRLVYGLCGLTEEEIKVVEGTALPRKPGPTSRSP
jgi:hypothetical protein